jgi:hypothetical protein
MKERNHTWNGGVRVVGETNALCELTMLNMLTMLAVFNDLSGM